MNKKGFTLIELLITVVIIGIIALVSVPAINAVSKNIKHNMLDKKIKMIEEAAILKGQDIRNSIIYGNNKYKNNFKCKSILVKDLVPGYLDSDNGNGCTENCVVDPSNASNYLDEKEVIIYYKNKRIHAVVDINDNLECIEEPA